MTAINGFTCSAHIVYAMNRLLAKRLNANANFHAKVVCESWLGLSEQEFRVDKWNVCLVHAAAIRGSQLK